MILHAEQMGAGPPAEQATTNTPVCLLHGLFGQARNLGGVARALAATHRVISLDLRNHGASPHASGMDYRTLAGDVLETLAALDALPVALLGHSMGGKAAMASALLAPDRVTRLLVGDIAPVAYAHGNAALAASLQAIELRPGLTRAGVAEALSGAVADAAVRSFLAQNFMPGAAPAWRIGLGEIEAAMPDIEAWPDFGGAAYPGPALFVGGAQSAYISPADHAAISAAFPAARIEILPGAGHWLHADQPAAFNALACEFFG